MKIFRLLSLFAVILVSISCSNISFTSLDISKALNSRSGLNLSAKSIALVYISNENNAAEAKYNKELAKMMAHSLSKNYYDLKYSVPVYEKRVNKDFKLKRKDILNFMLELNCDVIFVLDQPRLYDDNSSDYRDYDKVRYNLNFTLEQRLFVYDSKNKEDKVYDANFKADYNYDFSVFSSQNNKKHILSLIYNKLKGQQITISDNLLYDFRPRWTSSGRLYVASLNNAYSNSWYRARVYAEKNQWAEASKIWLSLLKSNDKLQVSSAAYDLALSAYVLQDYSLAVKWLKLSDKIYKIYDYSDNLWTKISMVYRIR